MAKRVSRCASVAPRGFRAGEFEVIAKTPAEESDLNEATMGGLPRQIARLRLAVIIVVGHGLIRDLCGSDTGHAALFAGTLCYFSQDCFFSLAAKAMSIKRRIASEREGLSVCCFAQVSTANLV
jgi:hypothetical protein